MANKDWNEAAPHCTTQQRLQLLHEGCSSSNIPPPLLHFLYVNEQYKYVACLPLKSGCTSWKTILVNNTIKQPLPTRFLGRKLHGGGTRKYNIRKYHTYSKKDQEHFLNTYYKFMVVRNPLDRLESVYNDKIVRKTFGERAVKINKYIKEHNKYEAHFHGFLDYINSIPHMNGHWLPASISCDPCRIKYDKIIKLETQDEDLESVLPLLGPYGRGKQVHGNYKGTGAAATKKLPLFSNIDKDLFSRVLSMGYDLDMKLFGYTFTNTSSSEIMTSCYDKSANCC